MNELILALNVAGVRYLLMGGQAMRLAGMPRYSMDWDFSKPELGTGVVRLRGSFTEDREGNQELRWLCGLPLESR